MTARVPASAGRSLVIVLSVASLSGCATVGLARGPEQTPDRTAAIARAEVWSQTAVARMDVRRGPRGAGSFAPEAQVRCRYRDHDYSGSTPKFNCELPNGSDVKVKYGERNGEVYAEVAATRLLWALGFGADRMYPVRILCEGCPETADGPPEPGRVREYPIAAIEQKMDGREFDEDNPGWAWDELDRVDPERGASVAQRDALKLLAAMLQHTDSKPENQRLLCLDAESEEGGCRRPFMMISDVGKTFGQANAFNRDRPGSVNLEAWIESPVWDDPSGCRANLERSLTGSLENPLISEAGRRFLSRLLHQLTDRQLRDLFSVARFPERSRALDDQEATIEDWVDAFKDKVSQIDSRSCEPDVQAEAAS